MLDTLFMTVLDMTLKGSIVIVAVMLLRLCLKKAPKIFSYALWGVALFRLLCPWTPEAPVSAVPEITPVSESYTLEDTPISVLDAGFAAYQAVGDAVNGGLGVQHIHTAQPDENGGTKTVTASWWEVWVLFGQYVWVAGVAALAGYCLVSYLRLRRQLVGATRLKENVYLADHVNAPFVLGLFRPKIYLPSRLSPREREYIIAHEQHHIRRLDHVYKFLAFGALMLHWFNPLAWFAYRLFCRDMELSCDEAVVKKLGPEIRADYATSLLNLATGRTSLGFTPLAFGEGDTKGRIMNLAKWKKPSLWLCVGAGALLLTAAALLITGQSPKIDDRLSVFLDTQIAQHHQSDKTTGRASCLDWQVLDVEKKGGKTTVYLWVLYEEYTMSDGQLQLESGAHVPTVITAEKREGQYHLTEYWQPGDGSNYAPDIRDKFPWHLEGKALNSQRYIKGQKENCQALARDYFAARENAQPGGVSTHEGFAVQLSYVGYVGTTAFFAEALNTYEMAQSSVLHLPIYKMDTREELDGFITRHESALTLDQSYDEVPAFGSVIEGYDEDFFEENTLVLVYISASSGSYRYGVEGIYCGQNAFSVHVKKTKDPVSHTDDMAGWFLCIAVPDTMVRNVEKFDADLDASGYLRGEFPKVEIENDGENTLCRVSTYMPATSLHKLSDTVKNKIAEDWRIHDSLTPAMQLSSSHIFGWITMPYDTWQQCEEALGVSVKNPIGDISWLKKTDVYGGIATDPSILHARLTVRATDSAKRTVERATIDAGYRTEDVRVVVSASVHTENTLFVTGYGADGTVEFDRRETTTGSGIPVMILDRSQQAEYASLDAWWVVDNVYYSLHLVGEKGRDDHVMDTMEKLLKEI